MLFIYVNENATNSKNFNFLNGANESSFNKCKISRKTTGTYYVLQIYHFIKL